ncbi:hypothetical protein GGS23DRAFT_550089 [Durotheca rogersii]|uniref:uncharacterized protein n=1 Tax=Durotheca rogersii TaxID=419775 RepID=UPI002220C5A9|nr:uncharacterized protein GGS23DRAFT_550089 [Durotheca rogersii]KAI5867809.1 hypothetical protein GGS23DRAFT_550089 [Durotheca rogersii]
MEASWLTLSQLTLSPDTESQLNTKHGLAPTSYEGEKQAMKALSRGLASLSVDAPASFPQFSRLPPELRRNVWRQSWGHRNAEVARTSLGVRASDSDFVFHDALYGGASHFRASYARVVQREWGVREPDQQPERQSPYQPITLTRCKTSPVSLWVNRESRDETLRYFEFAFALPGNDSSMYFNFGLDVLKFSLHSPLSAAFSVPDLRRLQRLCIPELVPAAPGFPQTIQGWGAGVEVSLPEVDDESVVDYSEFRYVWRLLREWFPSLREIRLEPFYTCKHYGTSREHDPLVPNSRFVDDIVSLNEHCPSCVGVQNAIKARFRSIGRTIADDGHADLERVLDYYAILRPVSKEETLVIGRAPPRSKGCGEGELVTVTYQAIYDGDAYLKTGFDPAARRLDWPMVRRQCVARTLEHALGPPRPSELIVCEI